MNLCIALKRDGETNRHNSSHIPLIFIYVLIGSFVLNIIILVILYACMLLFIVYCCRSTITETDQHRFKTL